MPAIRRLLFSLLCLPLVAKAHFLELIPSSDILGERSPRELQLDLTFTHPMSRGPAMPLAKPVRFGVRGPQGDEDLLDRLRPTRRDGQPAFSARYRPARPGDHVFYVEPQPYWEPAEGKWIVHYTKLVVDAWSGAPGWQQPLGLPVEIEPLSRPYGLWTGNSFRGIVRHHGQPVPFATVEIEWRNDGSLQPPADAYRTQVVRADSNGVFSYAIPRAGWWGFAALVNGPPRPAPDGKPAATELGGLIWVFARDMK